jgi:hypothetical protein
MRQMWVACEPAVEKVPAVGPGPGPGRVGSGPGSGRRSERVGAGAGWSDPAGGVAGPTRWWVAAGAGWADSLLGRCCTRFVACLGRTHRRRSGRPFRVGSGAKYVRAKRPDLDHWLSRLSWMNPPIGLSCPAPGKETVRHMREQKPGARLKQRAATAMGMVALSGFVAVGACVAASISLWEVSGELRQAHAGSRSSRRPAPRGRYTRRPRCGQHSRGHGNLDLPSNPLRPPGPADQEAWDADVPGRWMRL